MKKYYFAYGSNLSQARLEQRVGKVINLGVFRLWGYQLCFNAGNMEAGPYANIWPVGGSSFVDGVVYQLTPRQIKILDHHEGAPHYYTRMIEQYKGKDLQVYIAIQPHYTNIVKRSISPDYLRYILDGAAENAIKTTIETLLKVFPTTMEKLNKK